MKKIVLASGNQGKLKEINDMLSDMDVEIISQNSLHIDSIEETGLSFIENAILKARHASKKAEMPALADDSGLMIDALKGGPGIYSARYAGEHATKAEHIQKILDVMKEVPQSQRQAQFVCTLAYVRHSLDPLPWIFTGIWRGSILTETQGEHGFGYDSIFYVPEKNMSAASLQPSVKNALSHRGKALHAFKGFLVHE